MILDDNNYNLQKKGVQVKNRKQGNLCFTRNEGECDARSNVWARMPIEMEKSLGILPILHALNFQ